MLLKPGHDPYLRNPLARTSYVGLYVMVLIEILTGFAMYYMTEPNNIGGMLFGWVNVVLGGEMVTHWVHHIVAWLIIVFAIGHVYMVLRADLWKPRARHPRFLRREVPRACTARRSGDQ